MEVLLDARATRQVAEVQEAVAILHIVENYHRDLPDNPMPGRGRLVELAAEGGPKLNEFVPLELSAALGVSQQSITLLIADLLDLEYRHPLLWRAGPRRRDTACGTPAGSPPGSPASNSGCRPPSSSIAGSPRSSPGSPSGRSLKLLEGLIAAVDPHGRRGTRGDRAQQALGPHPAHRRRGELARRQAELRRRAPTRRGTQPLRRHPGRKRGHRRPRGPTILSDRDPVQPRAGARPASPGRTAPRRGESSEDATCAIGAACRRQNVIAAQSFGGHGFESAPGGRSSPTAIELATCI